MKDEGEGRGVMEAGSVALEDARTKHQTNPFWQDLQMEIHRRKLRLHADSGPKAIVSLGTGEKEGVAEVSRIIEVDGDQFIKVFTRYLTVFFEISKNGQKLFEYALAEAAKNKNQDALLLHPKDADRYHKSVGRSGYSQASFYRAADELCVSRILARSDVSWKFFINPAIFWNGSRVDFITELRKAPQLYSPGQASPVDNRPTEPIQSDLFIDHDDHFRD